MDKPHPVIYVIDDDESVRRALRRLLKSVGYSVETFASAAEFLEQGDQDAIDCLILDVKMPGMSGLELQEKLIASSSKIPIIFITAHHGDFLAQGIAMRRGAAAFIHKPFDDQVIISAIQAAINPATGQ